MNCSTLVRPVDVSPIRSPQAVHTALLPIFQDKNLVEIGTRNGDGMECYAHVAKSAKAIEHQTQYCRRLRLRNSTLFNASQKHFDVSCKDYRVAGVLDADYVLFWHERPHLVDPTILWHLNEEARRGLIRRDARAVVLSDLQSYEDAPSWRLLKTMAERRFEVPFNEYLACRRGLRGRSLDLCRRARGGFGVSIIRVMDINRTTLHELIETRKRVIEKKKKSWPWSLWG